MWSHSVTCHAVPPDTSEHTPSQPQPDRPVVDLANPEGWKAELTWTVTDASTNPAAHGRESNYKSDVLTIRLPSHCTLVIRTVNVNLDIRLIVAWVWQMESDGELWDNPQDDGATTINYEEAKTKCHSEQKSNGINVLASKAWTGQRQQIDLDNKRIGRCDFSHCLQSVKRSSATVSILSLSVPSCTNSEMKSNWQGVPLPRRWQDCGPEVFRMLNVYTIAVVILSMRFVVYV